MIEEVGPKRSLYYKNQSCKRLKLKPPIKQPKTYKCNTILDKTADKPEYDLQSNTDVTTAKKEIFTKNLSRGFQKFRIINKFNTASRLLYSKHHRSAFFVHPNWNKFSPKTLNLHQERESLMQSHLQFFHEKL